MHKYLFVLFCFFSVANLNGQSWKVRELGDPFDGASTSAYVLGKSSSTTYRKPILVLNQYENKESNFYISNAGYFQESSDINIRWIFDGSNEIFTTYDFSCSNDGKSLFILEVNHITFLSDVMGLKEFLHFFHNSNNVTIRITDRFSETDLTFSLVGFTKSASSIISKEKADEAYNSFYTNALLTDKLLYDRMLIASKLIAKAEVEFGLSYSDLERFRGRIDLDFHLHRSSIKTESSHIEPPYDSIYAVPLITGNYDYSKKEYWDKEDINIYKYSSGEGEKGKHGIGYYSIGSDSRFIKEYEKREFERIKEEELHAKYLYDRLRFLNLKTSDNKEFLPVFHSFTRSFKDNILAKIYYELKPFGDSPFLSYGENAIRLKDVAKIEIELSPVYKWKVETGKVSITLVDGRTIKCDDFKLYRHNDDILDKADLKQIGYYGGQTIEIEIPEVSTEYLKRKEGKPKLAPIFIPE
jgi:hypothetical protein